MTGAVRQPQQERSRLTRERLLRATIDTLARDGWATVTVANVAERAGVSRGAAQHHFRTREDLITAALEQIFDDMTESVSVVDDAADGEVADCEVDDGEVDDGEVGARIAAAIERAVELYTGVEFKASLQVWAAAASDSALRELILPLEARFARAAHRMTVTRLDPTGTDPRVHRVAQVTLDLARGLGLADTLSDDAPRRAEVVAAWTEMVTDALRSDA